MLAYMWNGCITLMMPFSDQGADWATNVVSKGPLPFNQHRSDKLSRISARVGYIAKWHSAKLILILQHGHRLQLIQPAPHRSLLPSLDPSLVRRHRLFKEPRAPHHVLTRQHCSQHATSSIARSNSVIDTPHSKAGKQRSPTTSGTQKQKEKAARSAPRQTTWRQI